MKERINNYNDVAVEHIFEPAKQDRQHLLIVFSGFSVDYEFRGNAAEGCRSNILWIKDKFFGDYTYYLCYKQNFFIVNAVLSLIDSYGTELGLSKDQCTLMGFSKGGSAALFYALKYGFNNVIASCPQLDIGTYVSTNWRRPARHMLGEGYTNSDIDKLNALIPDLLNSDAVVNKNIYLISSPQDVQYKTEIEPYLDLFWRCKNFNFIFTKSTLAWQHNKVTRYNIPIILSIIHAHGEGVIPHFGQVVNGVSHYDAEQTAVTLSEQRNKLDAISLMHKVILEDNVLHPSGAAFIKGFECKHYRQIKQTLLLCGEKNYEFPLGKVMNEDLSYQHFDKVFCDYRAGGFSSVGHNGIDLTNIERGSYSLKLKIESCGITVVKDISSQKKINQQRLVNDKVYSVYQHGDKILLSINHLVDFSSLRHFEVKKKWLVDNVLHYEGAFVIKGLFVENWGDVSYYLTIKSPIYEKCYKLGMCHYDELNEIFENHIGTYQKSYFCTLGSKGIQLENNIPEGNHNIYISICQNGMVYCHEVDEQLSVHNDVKSLVQC